MRKLEPQGYFWQNRKAAGQLWSPVLPVPNSSAKNNQGLFREMRNWWKAFEAIMYYGYWWWPSSKHCHVLSLHFFPSNVPLLALREVQDTWAHCIRSNVEKKTSGRAQERNFSEISAIEWRGVPFCLKFVLFFLFAWPISYKLPQQ